ncbi:MAG TPA: S8 family serine peptidase [Micromonosporaceae bacterium]|nr:S8 family serine peptidase [Micromonosporaceae bacterium]
MRGRAAFTAGATALLLFAAVPPAYADGIRDAQWHLGFLDVAAAHRTSQGTGVTVAVVDSGLDATHPDLAGTGLPAVDATRVPDSLTQSDVDGRGTALAGLVAGHGHGGAVPASPRPGTGPVVGPDGVLGLAPGARILPVVITTRPGQYGDPDVLADGIDLAVAGGAKVICVGRGLPGSPRLEQAVAAATRADVVVVAPAVGRPGEAFLPWPAAYPGVVAVAPLDREGRVTVKPGNPPTLAAPGTDLVTTDSRGGYRIESSTGAAGVVAGAVALVRARHPNLAGPAVVQRLTRTATDRGRPGPDEEYGSGVLNLVQALTAAVPVAPPSPSPSATGQAIAPTGTASPVPAGGAPGAKPVARPAFDSGDWRRWLVAVPLLAFLAALAFLALGRRPAPGGEPPGSAGGR